MQEKLVSCLFGSPSAIQSPAGLFDWNIFNVSPLTFHGPTKSFTIFSNWWQKRIENIFTSCHIAPHVLPFVFQFFLFQSGIAAVSELFQIYHFLIDIMFYVLHYCLMHVIIVFLSCLALVISILFSSYYFHLL